MRLKEAFKLTVIFLVWLNDGIISTLNHFKIAFKHKIILRAKNKVWAINVYTHTHTHTLDTKANHRWLGTEICKENLENNEALWNILKLKEKQKMRTHITQIRMTKQAKKDIGCISYKVKNAYFFKRTGDVLTRQLLIPNYSWIQITNIHDYEVTKSIPPPRTCTKWWVCLQVRSSKPESKLSVLDWLKGGCAGWNSTEAVCSDPVFGTCRVPPAGGEIGWVTQWDWK